MLDERSYRGPNGPNLQTTYGSDSYFIGPDQLAWLKRALLNSRATWKVIASDMPLSLIVWDDATNKKGSEAFAQGDGPPRGRWTPRRSGGPATEAWNRAGRGSTARDGR